MFHFNRSGPRELKIPYVRLERLKIHASESGELPVFKLQPQDSEQEGSFLLIIECGTQSSSMAIRVSGICLKFSLFFSLLFLWLIFIVTESYYTLNRSLYKYSYNSFHPHILLWWAKVRGGSFCFLHSSLLLPFLRSLFHQIAVVFLYSNSLDCLSSHKHRKIT